MDYEERKCVKCGEPLKQKPSLDDGLRSILCESCACRSKEQIRDNCIYCSKDISKLQTYVCDDCRIKREVEAMKKGICWICCVRPTDKDLVDEDGIPIAKCKRCYISMRQVFKNNPMPQRKKGFNKDG